MGEASAMEAISIATRSRGRVELNRDGLTRGLRGTLCVPTDAGFDQARALFNAVHDRRPGLIIQCAGVSDIMRCVALARENDLLISIRGGGHHVNGFASCDGGLMIDLSPMRSVRVDPVKRTALAEPGCTLFDLDTECQAFGLAAPSGIVSNTGIAGLSLGGGLGWLMRSYGLTIDNILGFEIVTADGRLRKANAEEHPDLFWALRGGGGNFGIVTSFQYRLVAIESVTAGWIYYPIEKAREFMQFYRDFVDQTSDRLVAWGTFVILPGGIKNCGLSVCYNGPAEEAEEAIRPLREFGVAPVLDDVRRMTYLELQSMTDQGPLPGLRYHQKAGFCCELGDELIDTLIASFDTAPMVPGVDNGLRVVAGFQTLDGAVGRVPNDVTAFPHRDKKFQFEITSMWDNPANDQANRDWTESFNAAFAPFASPGHYINGHMDTAEDFARAAYGPECYERLAAIKGKYDPDNMFRTNYNIRPTGTSG